MSKTKNLPKSTPGTVAKAGSGYPAPADLATPSDLKPDEIKNVVTAVNPLIADALAFIRITFPGLPFNV